MQQICKFLVEYWQVILSLFLALATAIIAALKKPTRSNLWSEIYYYVLTAVPSFVCIAEQQGKSGSEKKIEVINLALSMAKSQLGRCLSLDEENRLTAAVSQSLEMVLSAPTKEGGLGRGS